MPEALAQWGRLTGPAKVLGAIRRRLEAGHGFSGRLSVDLTGEQRKEVGQLLGVRWTVSGRQVPAAGLAMAVREAGADLVDLVVALGGPLRDRPAERAEANQASSTERADARRVLVAAGIPEASVDAWLARPRGPRAGTGELLELAQQAAAVWRHIPAAGDEPVMLQVLAATALAADTQDRTHRLDRDRPLAKAILRLARGGDESSDPPRDAEGWRARWAELGVACDPLSSRVLVVNLPLQGSAAACRIATAAGSEPVWLTWQSLNGDFTVPPGLAVFVCENVSVPAVASSQLGDRCPALVCMDGQPSATARKLIRHLAAAGAHLAVRADDDPKGQEIVASVLTLAPAARFWRYHQRPARQAAADPRYEEDEIDALIGDLANAERT